METDKIVQMDPKNILVVPEDNPRYGPPADIAPLMESIQNEGGVNTPVEVEPLDTPVNGHKHKLTVGYRRYEAVVALNKSGAGLKLPVIVRERETPLARLKTQISENRDRRNLSPMDTAVACKKLLDAGLSKIQVREMFPRPTTGKKKGGVELAPASNAWLNMTLSFLDLPKEIRERIHDGRLGVKAAYELTRVAPEKRADVLARAEEEMEREMAREKADEDKFLKIQEKLDASQKAEEEAVTKLDVAKAEVELAEKAVEEAQRKAQAAYAKFQESGTMLANATTKEQKEKAQAASKKATEAFKSAEADAKGLEKKLVSAKKEADKIEAARKKVSEAAAEARARLAEARKPKAKAAGDDGEKGKGTTSSSAIKKAAAASGDGAHVVLTAAEMRKFIHDLSLTESTYPKVAAVGKIIHDHFAGGPTDGQTIKKLATLLGDGGKKK